MSSESTRNRRSCLIHLVLWVAFTGMAVSGRADPGSEATDWTNSLGMPFVRLEDGVLACQWETRVRDFQTFLQTEERDWPEPSFDQTPDHPVVNVSWVDAIRFCRWLTEKERSAGVIEADQKYRLPKESEWLRMNDYEEAEEPDVLVERKPVFPWNGDWPPNQGSGNYAPILAVDSFEHTAPVGSFEPNELGFYDLGGNVWEWCMDAYEGDRDLRVLKGGSWRMSDPSDLDLLARVGNVPQLRLPTYGFRVVVESGKQEP